MFSSKESIKRYYSTHIEKKKNKKKKKKQKK